MATYTQLLYHIVFSTKNRDGVLTAKNRELLLKYIWGIVKNKRSHLYRINAVKDHIHLLTHIHTSICLSDFVKTVKAASTKWIKQDNIFPDFSYWQDGYGAFTCTVNDKQRLTKYIMNQEEHHRILTFREEYKLLLEEAGIKFNEKYLW